MKDSNIGWTHHTMNFWQGCNKVSEECKECYIKKPMKRAGREPFHGPMRTKDWRKPFTWNRSAKKRGVRERVFTCSLSDFFHAGADEWRPEAWEVIRACDQLDWLVLTKRSERMLEHLPADWGKRGYDNVWLGVTCGISTSLWRLAHLRCIPAKLKFVSAEPLLEYIDFRPYHSFVDWIITGCEQAAKGKRRLMNRHWVEQVDKDCKQYGIRHFFKQAYDNDRGVPNEQPLLRGRIVQELPVINL